MTDNSSGSAVGHGLDDFLGHSNRAGGSASFLGNWKKNNPPEVRIVLHTQAPIISVWQHPWPKIVTRERDGREVREVWSGNFNSWEVEDVLQRQYLRDRDSGERQYPPTVCPMSILLEEIERMMREGELDWDQELFRFEGDDSSKGKVLFAACMTNKIKKVWEGLTDNEKRDARKRGIPGPADAWMTSMMAKCQYVFTVVDFDNPKDGIQIAKETTLVGDKTKKAIRDRRTSEGEDEGNPLINPYVIQWEYDKDAKKFDEKYEAIIIAKLAIPDDVMELIREKEAPELDRFVAPGDVEALRASMEDSYSGPPDLFDWDFIFAKAEALAGIDSEESADDVAGDIAGDTEGEDQAADKTAAKAKPKAKPEPDPDPEPESQGELPLPDAPDYLIAKREKDGSVFAADGCELFSCEDCGTIMRDGEDKCRKCGADYSEDEAPADEPPPPPPKSKSKAAKKKAAAKGKGKGSATARAKASGKDDVDF